MHDCGYPKPLLGVVPIVENVPGSKESTRGGGGGGGIQEKYGKLTYHGNRGVDGQPL